LNSKCRHTLPLPCAGAEEDDDDDDDDEDEEEEEEKEEAKEMDEDVDDEAAAADDPAPPAAAAEGCLITDTTALYRREYLAACSAIMTGLTISVEQMSTVSFWSQGPSSP